MLVIRMGRGIIKGLQVCCVRIRRYMVLEIRSAFDLVLRRGPGECSRSYLSKDTSIFLMTNKHCTYQL